MPAISIMMKPASGLCNMNCEYCFYTDETSKRENASYGIMGLSTLEQIIKKTLAFAEGSCSILFQGGEPTLAGLDFFKSVIELEKKWNVNNVVIQNSIQANGITITKIPSQPSPIDTLNKLLVISSCFVIVLSPYLSALIISALSFFHHAP